MSSSEVADAFVARRQQSARTPERSFYFEGDRLYSYGPHYVVARWDAGRIFVSHRPSSPTTSGHAGYLKRAAHAGGAALVRVYDASHTSAEELVWCLGERAKAEQESLKRVRRPKDAAAHLTRLTGWGKEWIKQTCVEHNLPMPTLPPWPEELIRLKAECIFRGYPV